MWVVHNDRFLPEEQAHISVLDHGFLYGDGVFETIRAYSGHIFQLEPHLQRLLRACDYIGVAVPIPSKGWGRTMHELLERNGLQDGIIRITVSRGQGPLGLDPALCPLPTWVMVVTAPDVRIPVWKDQGIDIGIIPWEHVGAPTTYPVIKSLSFLHYVLAKRAALRSGLFDALGRNAYGQLTECTTSNFFFVTHGRICTPALTCGILDGVTRATVIKLAKDSRIPVEEGYYDPNDLRQADESFLTNTGFEILPVRSIPGYFGRKPVPGPITRQLQATFQTLVQRQTQS